MRIEHVALYVEQLERMREFYSRSERVENF